MGKAYLIIMEKSKTNETVEKQSILSFPNKMNNLTFLVVCLGYFLVMTVLSLIISPGVNYTVIPEYEHKMGDPIVSVYFRKIDTLTEQNGKISSKETLTVYLEDNSTNKEEYAVNYEVSGLTLGDNMDYMYTGSRANFITMPMTHTVKSQVSIKDGGYKALFGKILYREKGTEDELTSYEFKEDVITLTKRELKKISNNDNVLEGKFSFTKSTIIDKETESASVSVTLSILTEDDSYHLDFQTFIVTADGEIYPIIGFYGYYATKKKTLSGYVNLSGNIEIKYLVVKGIFIDSSEEKTVYYYKEEIK